MLTHSNTSRQARRKEERDNARALKREAIAKMKAVQKVTNLISRIFKDESIEALAYKMGVIDRKRELTPLALVGVLMLACDGESVNSLESMCSDLREWFKIYITPQTLQARINNKNTVNFIKMIIDEVMKMETSKILEKILKKGRNLRRLNIKNKLFKYKRVLLQDSTVISLHNNLWRIFRGCGNSSNNAAVKCDFIIDLLNNQIIYMKCISGRIPDASLSKEILSFVKEGDLILRDLGYFNLPHFKQMMNENSDFVSRLSSNVNVYLNQNDEEPIDLVEYFQKNSVNDEIDINVYIGRIERIKVRLIGLKVPFEVLEVRRSQYKKDRKKEFSEFLNAWNNYTFMITNISAKQISIKGILILYKFRWQIELFFMSLKSVLSIDNITGSNKYRICCFLFLKLCISWITSMLYSCAQAINTSRKEISLIKFTKWIKRFGIFECIFIHDGFNYLFKAFERDMNLLYKRETKLEAWLVEENEFLEVLSETN